MIDVAFVGYRKYPSGSDGDIITLVPEAFKEIRSLKAEFNVCYVGIVEELKQRETSKNITQLLESNPDILGYLNYRDGESGNGFDKDYLEELLRRSDIPILMISGSRYAKNFAESIGINIDLESHGPTRLGGALKKLYNNE